MTKRRLTVLLMLLICSGVSVALGRVIELTMPGWVLDFRLAYVGTRCVLQHHDPYSSAEFREVYLADGGQSRLDPIKQNPSLRLLAFNYLPTTVFIAPLAMLPWPAANIIWTLLTAGGFTIAAFLMWSLGANYSSDISFYLLSIMIADSTLLFTGGNQAGIVVSLCVIAVWCFTQERYIPAGILCMAVSLAIKPHDSGMVWLYFLLTGGVCRKRALLAVVITVAVSLPAMLWVGHIAPHWMQELHSNLLADSSCGNINDPGPASLGKLSSGVIIDLQTVFSIFDDNPNIYNPASYLTSGVLLLVWSFVTLRSNFSKAKVWFALAAIAPLSMLPVYHRPYDATVLMLAIPACAMLWSKRGLTGWLALILTTLAIAFTGDFPLGFLNNLRGDFHPDIATVSGKLMTVLIIRPVPLILLAMGMFYLWIYVWHMHNVVEVNDLDAAVTPPFLTAQAK
jgi:Glycosyltransferase family 87